MGFTTLGVETLGPGGGYVFPIGAGDDVPRNPHMINLTDPGAVPAVLFEVLAQVNFSLALVLAEHERLAGWTAGGPLAIGTVKDQAAAGQLVDVRRLATWITVAAEHACFQVIGDNEEHVLDRSARCWGCLAAHWRRQQTGQQESP